MPYNFFLESHAFRVGQQRLSKLSFVLINELLFSSAESLVWGIKTRAEVGLVFVVAMVTSVYQKLQLSLALPCV